MTKDGIIISNKTGTVSLTLSATISKKRIRLNYKKRVMIKGRRRHSWYAEAVILNVSYEDLSSYHYGILEGFSKTEDYLIVYYQNNMYYMIIEGDSFESNSEYSSILADDLYKGSITLEETIEEEIV